MDLPSISNSESVASELNLELSAMQFRLQVPLRPLLCEEASRRELTPLLSSKLSQPALCHLCTGKRHTWSY